MMPTGVLTAGTPHAGAPPPPLSRAWPVPMAAGEMKFFGGWSLGVFAPRLGKKASCTPDDGYARPANGTSLQACFLECLGDAAEAFKEGEYTPLIEHHEDCETEEKTDAATGEVTKTVTKCCEACKCIFFKAGEDDE